MIYMAVYEPGSRLYNREREHSLGRSLLAFGLEKEYGHTWEVKTGDGAKPYLEGAPGISFNISHTEGMAVCAVSRRRVGVDVEQIRPFKEKLMRRVCSPRECGLVLEDRGPDMLRKGRGADMLRKGRESDKLQERFFRLWTLKESFVKAAGYGLKFPLRDITFSWERDICEGGIHERDICEGGIHERDICEGSNIKGSIPGWHYWQSMVYGSYIISVCEADEEGETV